MRFAIIFSALLISWGIRPSIYGPEVSVLIITAVTLSFIMDIVEFVKNL